MRVLGELGSANASQIDEHIGWRPTTAGRRIPELLAMGYVEKTGEELPTEAGCAGYAVQLTARGRAWMFQMTEGKVGNGKR